ncbi:hypothetical protein KP509_21G068900 [Ceratopteris richardii]|uniref:Uncharacterized protein n=1 Tax=Ceratopteris richardii TaxID=49495 RepID=A0A8T2SEC6_CERRI|nr:hypothetical protein KP509_21G068900 [Ceratopteris richardii]
MASGGLPHQPLSATFPAQFAKESLGPSNAGLLDNRGSAPASALPSSDAHPRHIVHDERDAFILWLRGEFAAANAIIDAMCNHLHVIGEPSEYDYLLACIQRRRFNWNVVLNMQQYFPVEEVNNALQQAALRKQQVRNQTNQPSMPHHNVEELKDPRTINLFRGSNGDAQNVIPQAEVSVSDMSVIMNRDLPLSNLSLPQELYNGKVIQNPASRMSKFDASQSRSKTVIDSMEQTTSQTSPNLTLAKSPVGQEIILGPENNTSTVLMKHPGTFGGKLFNADFTTLSREDQDARLPMIKVSKHFQCWEQAEGNLVSPIFYMHSCKPMPFEHGIRRASMFIQCVHFTYKC